MHDLDTTTLPLLDDAPEPSPASTPDAAPGREQAPLAGPTPATRPAHPDDVSPAAADVAAGRAPHGPPDEVRDTDPSGFRSMSATASGTLPDALPDALPDGLAPLVELLATRAHDPATIRELLEIQREFRAERAREAYSEALARFRAVAPTLPKDRTVHFASRDKGKPATHYRHTSIGYAMAAVNPLLGSLGLNISWHPHVADGVIHVETRLTHALGHAESITLPGAPDTSGNKNAIQAMKSTITYLERAGAFALLGLASSDDDDGHAAARAPEGENEFMTFEQTEDLSNLLDLIETLDPGYRARFLTHYASRYEPGDNPLGLDLPLARLDKATRMLKRKLADARATAAAPRPDDVEGAVSEMEGAAA